MEEAFLNLQMTTNKVYKQVERVSQQIDQIENIKMKINSDVPPIKSICQGIAELRQELDRLKSFDQEVTEQQNIVKLNLQEKQLDVRNSYMDFFAHLEEEEEDNVYK